MKKPIYCLELNKEYPSITAAAKELNIDVSQIAKVCKKQLRSVKGYHFNYVGDAPVQVVSSKEVSINKAASNKNNPYFIVNKSANIQAMASLSRVGFQLYMYFMQNEDGYVTTLRRTHAMKITGLSKSSYYDAMTELLSMGYLIDAGDGYEFYEEPTI